MSKMVQVGLPGRKKRFRADLIFLFLFAAGEHSIEIVGTS